MPYRKYRRQIELFTTLVIGVITLLVAASLMLILYRAEMSSQRERLTDLVHTVSHLVGNMRQEGTEKWQTEVFSHLAEQRTDSNRFGHDGRVLIARLDGAAIDYYASPPDAPANSGSNYVDQPMRLALSGESGTMLTHDPKGGRILVAFTPVPGSDLGVVAQMNASEISTPFLYGAAVAAALALACMLFGVAVLRRLSLPVFYLLEEDERRYRALFDLAPYGMVVIDPESGRHLEFNSVAHQQLGYGREEFAGLTVDAYEAEPQTALLRKLETTGDEPLEYHTLHQNRAGEIRRIDVRLQRTKVEGREVCHVVYHDLTERRDAEEELNRYWVDLEERVSARTTELEREMRERQEAEAGLRMADIVYENTAEGIFVTDSEQRIVAVNPAFTAITGYTDEEAQGSLPDLLRSERHDPEFFDQMWHILRNDGHWQGDLWSRRKDGETFLERRTMSCFCNEAGEVQNFVVVFQDITELYEKEQFIYHQSYHDTLTGLPNRFLFQDRLSQAQVHAARNGERFAVMLMDLDRFKVINDTLGHDTGDLLLKRAAERLRSGLRQGDTISRFGGDEFAILLGGVKDIYAVEHLAQKLIHLFEEPFHIGEHEFTVTTSIGISLFPADGEDGATLLKNADTAMYRAKERGRNNLRFYTADMNERAFDRLALENKLRYALERAEFELHYQPRVDLASGAITGMEALIRWHHPEEGMISPGQFIPVAEETGLIVPIGEWVLRTACRDTQRWREAGFGDLRVSVNISARQFTQADIVHRVGAALASSGLPPQLLELELTESLIMQQAENSIATLTELKARGVWLAVDDFGTGYSSLNYLKRFPIDILKIDQSFIRDLSNDPDDAAIAETIIALGHSLRLEVIAEGVETAEQLAFLRERGCDAIQGYFFSRPLPGERFVELLESGRGLEQEAEPIHKKEA